MPSPFKFGSEILVNTTTASNQFGSSIAGLADGRFVVSWTDDSTSGGDTSDGAVRAQVFNADGSPSGSEFLVNTTTAANQIESSVTGLADGRFVVSWRDDSATGGDTSGRAVRAQVFNADGSPSGGEFLVNTITGGLQYQSSIASLADGRFVVSWTDFSASVGDTSNSAIRAQLFNADGSPSGDEFLVNTTTLNNQYESTVTGLTDGKFVIIWTDASSTGADFSGVAVRGQLFNADGTASGGEFLVNTTTFNSQHEATVTSLADGRFVVSWSDNSTTGGDTSGNAVRAQVFNADGSPSGAEFLVNTTTDNTQHDPSITGLADGRFVVSWTDFSGSSGDTTGGAIRAQVFDIDGSRAGEEFVVNTTTALDQYESSVTAMADGRFVVSWTDISETGGDTTGTAVRAQIFDPRETAIDLNGSLFDDDFVGTRFGDDISGFIGDDAISGRSGDDDLFGEAGEDTLYGNSGNDRLYGGADDDVLRGNFGTDQLFGGDGDDNLNGGFGLDFLEGGAGDDTYSVDNVGDIVVEGAMGGTDLIRSGAISLDLADHANVENLRLTGVADLNLDGNAGDNVLTGNDGANKITGKGGADMIEGREGADNLAGNGGADVLIGGLGRDKLTGGGGADHFVFETAADTGVTGATRDQILDFNQAQGDRIDLSGIDAGSAGGDQAFTFIGVGGFSMVEGELRFVQNAGKTFVRGDIDGDGAADFEIALEGLHVLVAGDFVL